MLRRYQFQNAGPGWMASVRLPLMSGWRLAGFFITGADPEVLCRLSLKLNCREVVSYFDSVDDEGERLPVCRQIRARQALEGCALREGLAPFIDCGGMSLEFLQDARIEVGLNEFARTDTQLEAVCIWVPETMRCAS